MSLFLFGCKFMLANLLIYSYKDQFNTHLEQMEKLKKQLEEWYNEPIPEDLDVKDED
ncbi:hypothetical protein N1I87_07440 [Bacillus sp. FSL W8-0102]|uniref:hypothetical protein n=1 Tax=Bacillus sp. FSL W8-0102 TaxID=2978205 RepID=UPI0030FBCF5A